MWLGNVCGSIHLGVNISDEVQSLEYFFNRVDEGMKMRAIFCARVLLVAFSPEQLQGLRDYLRGMGVHVTAATPNVKQLPDVGRMGTGFTHILINFDAFDDLETGVEVLSAFRKHFGHVLILCSAQVASDDLGSERSAICDATLRSPVTPERLRLALRAATTNRHERAVSANHEGARV